MQIIELSKSQDSFRFRTHTVLSLSSSKKLYLLSYPSFEQISFFDKFLNW